MDYCQLRNQNKVKLESTLLYIDTPAKKFFWFSILTQELKVKLF